VIAGWSDQSESTTVWLKNRRTLSKLKSAIPPRSKT